VRSVGVVVSDVLTQNSFEMSLRDNQDPGETLVADAADPAFRVRLRRCNWRADHADAVGAAERIEGFGELDVAVADQDPRCLPSLLSVARTLRACCVTQAPFGWAVMPAMWTRRRSSSRKKKT
jgi:hypothetical protein